MNDLQKVGHVSQGRDGSIVLSVMTDRGMEQEIGIVCKHAIPAVAQGQAASAIYREEIGSVFLSKSGKSINFRTETGFYTCNIEALMKVLYSGGRAPLMSGQRTLTQEPEQQTRVNYDLPKDQATLGGVS